MKSLGIFLLAGSLCLTVQGQMLDKTDSRARTTFNDFIELPGFDMTKMPRQQKNLPPGWKAIGTIRPKNASEVEGPQMITLGCETLCRDYIYWDTYKEYVAPLGIKRIRLQGGWAKTEQKPGEYNFAWLDSVIDDARSRGLEVWLETDYGNPIYPGGGSWDLGAGFPTSPEGLAAWDRWVTELATRYKGKVRDWAMWNEPDCGGKTPEMIALFNIRTAEIIKRIIPDARIGALSLASNNPKLVEACMDVFARENKLDLFDWVIYHGYAYNPDTSYKNVMGILQAVRKYSDKIQLWQGENGAPSEMARKFALSDYPWTELTQAKWDARRILGDLGHDVVSSVFTLCEFDHKGREINHKGLLKINDKQTLAKVKMAYYTVQNIASVFDASLTRIPEYACTLECETPLTWYAYRDAKRGCDLVVFWDGTHIPSNDNTPRKATLTLPANAFADPVFADLISGVLYEIPAEQKRMENGKWVFTDLPCYDAPVLVTERTKLVE
ncbi:MAG: beta-galactosidase [Planctomycetia bacterium]|nr:beta-galactosidase [Planctomycetia bacterium]